MAQREPTPAELLESIGTPTGNVAASKVTRQSITEYLYGCRRATIEMRGEFGKIQEYTFDEPRLEVVRPEEPKPKPKQDTGGDRPAMPRTGVAS